MTRLAAFLAMSLVWGLTWLPSKLAAEAVPPILLAGIRFILAGLCLGLFAIARRVPLAAPEPARVLAAALLITTGCYGPLFWGIARAPTGLSALVNLSLMPVFVMLIGAAYGLEAVTARRLASVALGAGGLALLFSTRIGAAGDGASVAAGLAAVVVGTASYAWGAVLSRPLVHTMPPVALAFWETLLGGLALLPVSAVVEGASFSGLAGVAEPKALFGLAFLVVAGSLVGFSAYLWLVREWGAFRAGLYCFVSPSVAVAVGVAWAGEPLRLAGGRRHGGHARRDRAGRGGAARARPQRVLSQATRPALALVAPEHRPGRRLHAGTIEGEVHDGLGKIAVDVRRANDERRTVRPFIGPK